MNGNAHKSSRRRNRALVEYGKRHSGSADAGPSRKSGQRLLWVGLALAGIAVLALVRSPAI